jgi:hypothetical protein
MKKKITKNPKDTLNKTIGEIITRTIQERSKEAVEEFTRYFEETLDAELPIWDGHFCPDHTDLEFRVDGSVIHSMEWESFITGISGWVEFFVKDEKETFKKKGYMELVELMRKEADKIEELLK